MTWEMTEVLSWPRNKGPHYYAKNWFMEWFDSFKQAGQNFFRTLSGSIMEHRLAYMRLDLIGR